MSPNPATDYVTIEGLTGAETVTIHDLNGRMVSEHAASGSEQLLLDISHLQSGIYLIKISSQHTMIMSYKLFKK